MTPTEKKIAQGLAKLSAECDREILATFQTGPDSGIGVALIAPNCIDLAMLFGPMTFDFCLN